MDGRWSGSNANGLRRQRAERRKDCSLTRRRAADRWTCPNHGHEGGRRRNHDARSGAGAGPHSRHVGQSLRSRWRHCDQGPAHRLDRRFAPWLRNQCGRRAGCRRASRSSPRTRRPCACPGSLQSQCLRQGPPRSVGRDVARRRCPGGSRPRAAECERQRRRAGRGPRTRLGPRPACRYSRWLGRGAGHVDRDGYGRAACSPHRSAGVAGKRRACRHAGHSCSRGFAGRVAPGTGGTGLSCHRRRPGAGRRDRAWPFQRIGWTAGWRDDRSRPAPGHGGAAPLHLDPLRHRLCRCRHPRPTHQRGGGPDRANGRSGQPRNPGGVTAGDILFSPGRGK